MSLKSLKPVLSAASVVLAMGLTALGADGTASGWLEVKGQRVALTHICAISETDRLEKGDKEIVAVLLSTQPVPPEMRKPGMDIAMWAGEEARAGRINGIVLMIDPKTNIWSRGQRLSKEYGLTFYSHSSTSAEGRVLRFEPAPSGPAELAGKVSMSEPMRGMDENDGPWRLEAEFRTPVVQQEPITGVISGAAALKSPQYKAVMVFIGACKRQDLASIRASMDADSQAMLAKMVEQLGQAEALKMLAGMAADSQTMRSAEVTVRGAKAEVKLMNNAGQDRNEHSLTVALENGVWKMSR